MKRPRRLHRIGGQGPKIKTVYGKDQKDDLSAEDKTLYRQFVQILKAQAKRSRGHD